MCFDYQKYPAMKNKLTYLEMFKANDLFVRLPNTFNREWIHAHKFVDWDNLYNLSDQEVMNRVVKFLNQWSSHIKQDNNVVIEIKQAHRDSIPYLHSLKEETLWDLNLNKMIQVNGKELEVQEAIFSVFKRFTEIGYHLRNVASSKLLHHIQPNLFIMWDNKIMKAYGVRGTPEDYTYNFLPMMSQRANEVIDTYMNNHKLHREEAISQLNSFKKYKTLVKLLDEYNWMNYTYFERSM